MNKTQGLAELGLSWMDGWSARLKELSGEHDALAKKHTQFRHGVDEMRWAIGECLLDGLAKIGPGNKSSIFQKAKEITGYSEKTLRNYAYVAGEFSSLRRDGLEWSHYKELFESGLDDEKKARLLATAAVSDWKVRDLQRAINREKRPRGKNGENQKTPLPANLSVPEHVMLARREMTAKVVEFMFKRYRLGENGGRLSSEIGPPNQPVLQVVAARYKRTRKLLPVADLLAAPWRWTGFPSRFEDRSRDVLSRGLLAQGQLNPIHVYPSPEEHNKYRIIDGHMVVECARQVGLADLEAEIYHEIDETTAKLLYVRFNLVRAEMNHAAIAAVLRELADELGGWPAIAKEMSWDPDEVESYVRLGQFDWEEFLGDGKPPDDESNGINV
jgi:hypothetical protein